MKIFGLGTDIVNIKRIEDLLAKHGIIFKNKIFSTSEIAYCEKKKNCAPYYAKRYAAKEAFLKALGVGIGKGFVLKNIEISNDKSGKPLIKLKGRTLSLFKKKIKSKKYQIDLSLSDDNPWAHATVIISCYK